MAKANREHYHYVGVLNDKLVTWPQLKQLVSIRLLDYVLGNKRVSNFIRFIFCPICGQVLPWIEYRKEAEANESFEQEEK